MTGNWSNYASMLVPRSQMGCLVLDDCLYVIGGTNRRNEVLQSVERYHFKEDRFDWQFRSLAVFIFWSSSIQVNIGRVSFFKKMGQSRPLCVYFCSFLVTISIQIEKSVDGVLGIRTCGCMMVGADETTELWRPPKGHVSLLPLQSGDIILLLVNQL